LQRGGKEVIFRENRGIKYIYLTEKGAILSKGRIRVKKERNVRQKRSYEEDPSGETTRPFLTNTGENQRFTIVGNMKAKGSVLGKEKGGVTGETFKQKKLSRKLLGRTKREEEGTSLSCHPDGRETELFSSRRQEALSYYRSRERGRLT